MFVLHLEALDQVYCISHRPGELQIGRQFWDKRSYIEQGRRWLGNFCWFWWSLPLYILLPLLFNWVKWWMLKTLATSRNFSVFQNLVGNTCYSNVPSFYLFLSTVGNQLAYTSWEKSFPAQCICIISSLPLIWKKGNKIIGRHNDFNQVLNYGVRKVFNII